MLKFARTEHRQVVRAFDRTALPLIEQTLRDDRRRHTVRASLLGTSMKVGLAMWGYASMARVPFDAELSFLGSSFTRLYDDLIDHCDRDDLDIDLCGLFAGESFRPHDRLEELLILLHGAIAMRMPHLPDDPIYPLLRHLHEVQLRSRRQRNSDLSCAEIVEITRGKGGLGMVALLALLRPRMSPREHDLIMELGDLFQLLDDLHDLALDRAEHITTSATLGAFSLTELAARITALSNRFRAHYGTSHPLSAHLALTLIGAPLAARRGRRTSPGPVAAFRPPRQLFSRVDNIRP